MFIKGVIYSVQNRDCNHNCCFSHCFHREKSHTNWLLWEMDFHAVQTTVVVVLLPCGGAGVYSVVSLYCGCCVKRTLRVGLTSVLRLMNELFETTSEFRKILLCLEQDWLTRLEEPQKAHTWFSSSKTPTDCSITLYPRSCMSRMASSSVPLKGRVVFPLQLENTWHHCRPTTAISAAQYLEECVLAILGI